MTWCIQQAAVLSLSCQRLKHFPFSILPFVSFDIKMWHLMWHSVTALSWLGLQGILSLSCDLCAKLLINEFAFEFSSVFNNCTVGYHLASFNAISPLEMAKRISHIIQTFSYGFKNRLFFCLFFFSTFVFFLSGSAIFSHFFHHTFFNFSNILSEEHLRNCWSLSMHFR